MSKAAIRKKGKRQHRCSWEKKEAIGYPRIPGTRIYSRRKYEQCWLCGAIRNDSHVVGK